MSHQKVDVKVVLLGKEYGGKTSLVERFVHSRFNQNQPYQNDTAGSERYEAMSRIYYRGAKAAIVCYDLTDDQSWDRARFWIQEVHGHEEECKIYLCGTKRDLLEHKERAVDYHDTTDYADTINAKLFETSAKSGENIDELFEQIASDYIATGMPLESPHENTIDLNTGLKSQNAASWRKMCCG